MYYRLNNTIVYILFCNIGFSNLLGKGEEIHIHALLHNYIIAFASTLDWNSWFKTEQLPLVFCEVAFYKQIYYFRLFG